MSRRAVVDSSGNARCTKPLTSGRDLLCRGLVGWGVSCILLSCTGSTLDESSDAGRIEVSDGGRIEASDGGDRGGADLDLSPSDNLLAPSEVVLVPGALACIDEVSILRSSGAIETRDAALPGLSIEWSPSVKLQASLPTDCAGQGLIGTAPSEGTFTVRLEDSDGDTVQATSRVVVHDAAIEFTWAPITVPAGLSLPYPIGFSAEGLSPSSSFNFVARWLELSTADPMIAQVSRSGEGRFTRFEIRGESPGATRIVGSYGPEDNRRPLAAATDHLTVVGAVQLAGVQRIRFARGASVDASTLTPGECYELILDGLYVDEEGAFVTLPVGDATWTSLGDVGGLQSSTVCPKSSGDMIIRGCRESFCAVAARATYAAGEVSGLTLSGGSVSGHSAVDAQTIEVCPTLSVEARFSSGETRDVTLSPGAALEIDWSQPQSFRLLDVRDAEGHPNQDSEGRRCFLVSGVNSSHPEFDLPIQVEYAGFVAGGITIRVE